MMNFLKSESGAVTVDWVVLTAALVGLSLAVGATLLPAINGAAANIATSIGNVTAVTCPTGQTWSEASGACA